MESVRIAGEKKKKKMILENKKARRVSPGY
jgi:hypothetical protein